MALNLRALHNYLIAPSFEATSPGCVQRLLNRFILHALNMTTWSPLDQSDWIYPKGYYEPLNVFYLKTKYFHPTMTKINNNTLKTLDTIGNWQRQVFSLGVSQHMHKITNLSKFELNWSSKLWDNNERKNTLSQEVVCFQMLDFETSNSKSEVSKSTPRKITSFSKTTSPQREPFLPMFYTINLSPLFVTK